MKKIGKILMWTLVVLFVLLDINALGSIANNGRGVVVEWVLIFFSLIYFASTWLLSKWRLFD